MRQGEEFADLAFGSGPGQDHRRDLGGDLEAQILASGERAGRRGHRAVQAMCPGTGSHHQSDEDLVGVFACLTHGQLRVVGGARRFPDQGIEAVEALFEAHRAVCVLVRVPVPGASVGMWQVADG
ncbi:MAG: hypothetical protein AUG49_19695 [Catenulispora sp. 13_1_20CM_3_70_7]|nr:MAG: hypothetical protein AUG49_19695 [Catenulispora sp. 13_1_20CM_3_70_7]